MLAAISRRRACAGGGASFPKVAEWPSAAGGADESGRQAGAKLREPVVQMAGCSGGGSTIKVGGQTARQKCGLTAGRAERDKKAWRK